MIIVTIFVSTLFVYVTKKICSFFTKLDMIKKSFLFEMTTLILGVLSSRLYLFLFLFDLILYVHSTIFQLCGAVLPGFNQY